jgi:hypothetical protein
MFASAAVSSAGAPRQAGASAVSVPAAAVIA